MAIDAVMLSEHELVGPEGPSVPHNGERVRR